MLEAGDVEAWISANGDVPAGACVAMNSGWGGKMARPEFRNTPTAISPFRALLPRPRTCWRQ